MGAGVALIGVLPISFCNIPVLFLPAIGGLAIGFASVLDFLDKVSFITFVVGFCCISSSLELSLSDSADEKILPCLARIITPWLYPLVQISILNSITCLKFHLKF